MSVGIKVIVVIIYFMREAGPKASFLDMICSLSVNCYCNEEIDANYSMAWHVTCVGVFKQVL